MIYARTDFWRFWIEQRAPRGACALVAILGVWIAALTGVACAAPAGAEITNVAELTFEQGGQRRTFSSNRASMRVAELLDLDLLSVDPDGIDVEAAALDRALPFRLTNRGNGAQRFALGADVQIGGDDFDPENARLFLDDGDGVFDTAVDTLYIAGANDPLLAAGASVNIFVVADIPASLQESAWAEVRLRAWHAIGEGPVGEILAGGGANGVDAVRARGGVASASSMYRLREPNAASGNASLIKSSIVRDPEGGARAVQGARVTYALRAQFSGAVADATIIDPIPQGAAYVAGSMRVDGVVLSDAPDSDSGVFLNNTVRVALGPISGAGERLVTFEVVIQ